MDRTVGVHDHFASIRAGSAGSVEWSKETHPAIPLWSRAPRTLQEVLDRPSLPASALLEREMGMVRLPPGPEVVHPTGSLDGVAEAWTCRPRGALGPGI